jgi:hypothetical protein
MMISFEALFKAPEKSLTMKYPLGPDEVTWVEALGA